MLFYFPFFIVAYIILTGILYYFWLRIPSFKRNTSSREFSRVSVIIAARNEAENIGLLLEDLENQSFPKDKFEVIVLDDHSEDGTAQIIQTFIERNSLQLRLLKMSSGVGGKKKAIAEGVSNSQGILIVTTDGDCRVGKDWLSLLEDFYHEKKPKMITGGVSFFKGKSSREKILELEFASLVGSGASSLEMGYPSMCNGANLAYEKKAFDEVGGYSSSEHLASGDDEFLMHKIFRKYPNQVLFLKNKDSVVLTSAPKSWKSFIEQRKRWASKWENYSYTHVKLLALLIFGSNLAMIINFILAPFESYPLELFLLLLTFKFMVEFLFLRSVLVYFGRKLNVWVFLLTEMLYPFYVVYFALVGRTGKYKWKGREIGK